MWSRRAQEYQAKIASGDPASIAEVVRDLYRNVGQPEQSYSERQIYQAALDRLVREFAAVERIDPRGVIAGAIEVRRVIGSLVYFATEISEPGVIRHNDGKRISLGEPDGSRSERIRPIAQALVASGLKAPVTTNLRTEIWVKILGNVAFNPISALTRATLGQMAIRVALQCNEADAHLIMDENNSAPRLLTRPGEGIYNDAAGAMEGNSPFQVVWLPGEERDLWLDKVNALSAVLDVKVGQQGKFGSLTIQVQACKIHPADQARDSAAYLTITDSHADVPGFQGWMLANEPSASMLQSPIYDVRVVGCQA